MSSLVALQVKGNRPTDVGERDERENEKGYNALPLSSAAGSIQNEDGSGHPAIPEDCVLGIRSSIEQAEVGRRPIVRRKQTQKEKFGVTVLFPLALEILLFLTSAAQYTGASGISLTVVLTLNYSPIATNNFWMYMGFVGWFSPLIGWISDVFTIREERRRPCLAIGILGDAVCLLCIGLYAPQLHPAGFIALCLAQTAFEMMVFVPLNALVVELSKNRSLVRRRKETPSVWKRIAALSIWRKLKTKCSCCLCCRNKGSDFCEKTSDGTSSDGATEATPCLEARLCPTLPAQNDDTDSQVTDEAIRLSGTHPAGDREEEEVDEEAELEGTIEWEEELRVRASGAAQSHSMLLRSCGSLLGASLQTAALAYVNPLSTVIGAAVAWFVALLAVLWIPKDCTRNGLDQRQPQAGNLNAQVEQEATATTSATAGDQATTSGSATAGSKSWLPLRLRRLADRLRQSMKGGISSPFTGLVAILVFVFAYSGVPGASSIYYQYIAANFNFSAWYLSLNMALGLVSGIFACHFYSWKLARYSQVTVFLLGCGTMSLGYLTNIMLATGFSKDTLGISNSVFVMLDTIAVSFCSRIGFLPVLQIASSRCPKGFESSVFELFTATTLGASSVSALITSAMASALSIDTGAYGNLWVLLLICGLAKWVPVLFLGLLPKVVSASQRRQIRRRRA